MFTWGGTGSQRLGLSPAQRAPCTSRRAPPRHGAGTPCHPRWRHREGRPAGRTLIVLRLRSARAAACRVVHRDPTHPVPKTDHGRGRAPVAWTQTYVRLTRCQPRAAARRVSGTEGRVTPVRMLPPLDPREDRHPGLGLATGGSCIRHAPCLVVGCRGQRPYPALHPDPQRRDMRHGDGRLRRSATPPQPPRNSLLYTLLCEYRL